MIRYSCIIPTLNGEKKIATTLYALLRQSIPPDELEIIVVDDGSTDATRDVVKRFQKENPGHVVIYLFRQNGGPAAARNTGIRVARGTYLFFTDDDCEVPALWMEKMLNVYRDHPDVVGVGGWYAPPMNVVRKNVFHQFMYLYYHFIFGLGLYREGKNDIFRQYAFPAANGGNLSIKKWVVERVGGFDERFPTPGSEDVEFSERICNFGYSMYYLPQWVIDRKILTLRRFFRLMANRATGCDVYFKLAREHNDERVFISWSTLLWRFISYYRRSGHRLLQQRPSRYIFFLAIPFYFVMFSKTCRFFRFMRRKV